MNTGQKILGLTAAHVIDGRDGWIACCEAGEYTPLRLGGNNQSITLDWGVRCVAINPEIDVATFSISEAEVEQLGKCIYSGFGDWPPVPPTVDDLVIYNGYPGVATQLLSVQEVNFGAVCGTGAASSISESTVSSLIEREDLEPVLGGGIPPDNFDFGGISGGPMLRVFATAGGLQVHSLAGVIYSGPNVSSDIDESIPGFEVIRARRADYIAADGSLTR